MKQLASKLCQQDAIRVLKQLHSAGASLSCSIDTQYTHAERLAFKVSNGIFLWHSMELWWLILIWSVVVVGELDEQISLQHEANSTWTRLQPRQDHQLRLPGTGIQTSASLLQACCGKAVTTG
jgi:hypothetical protein